MKILILLLLPTITIAWEDHNPSDNPYNINPYDNRYAAGNTTTGYNDYGQHEITTEMPQLNMRAIYNTETYETEYENTDSFGNAPKIGEGW